MKHFCFVLILFLSYTGHTQSIVVTGYGQASSAAGRFVAEVVLSEYPYIEAGGNRSSEQTMKTLSAKFSGILRSLEIPAGSDRLISMRTMGGKHQNTLPYEVHTYEVELEGEALYHQLHQRMTEITGSTVRLKMATVSDVEGLKNLAYERALNDAQHRANRLARLSGFVLGQLKDIEDLSPVFEPITNFVEHKALPEGSMAYTCTYTSTIRISYGLAR